MARVDVCGDVIVEILTKLPVKSLLRFNCVCKTWYSVISDPIFSNKLHQMPPSVLICENRRIFSTITVESLLMTTKTRVATPLSPPWETDSESDPIYQIIGSCNGLVCINHIRSDLILWNPSTRKFKKLPRSGCYEGSKYTFAWFGYDEFIDDYKLVWLNCNPIITQLDVFTLKSNTWRRPPVDDMDLRPANVSFKNDDKSLGVLSHGAIHWLATCSSNIEEGILILDLVTEELRLLKFPHDELGFFAGIRSLFGGCLCILCSPVEEGGYYVKNLWMMKEYGVESSWIKLLSIYLPGFDVINYLPILFSSEGNGMVALFDCTNGNRASIVKLRVEEGKQVGSEETLLRVTRDCWQSSAVLHMEESVVSFTVD